MPELEIRMYDPMSKVVTTSGNEVNDLYTDDEQNYFVGD